MKKLTLLNALLIAGIFSFCQTVYNPKYAKSNMESHTLDRVDVANTNSETILYFTFTAKPGGYNKYCFTRICYTQFNLHLSATLKTNTGQVVKLLRCENLARSPFNGDNGEAYWSSTDNHITSWKAVFPAIDANATTIDFEENSGTPGSYFVWGIELGNNIIANTAKTVPAGSSVADEIMKLKKLLDAGVLTQQEFDAQKQKLLNTQNTQKQNLDNAH